MKKITVIAAIGAALFTTGVLGADKVKIGFVSTHTGGAAVLGKHQKDGFDLGLEKLNNKLGGLDVEVIYGDDQQKADIGRQVVDKMLERDKVDFVTGIIWSNVLMAVQQKVVRNETFLITTNAGAAPMAGKRCSKYFFSTSWNNDQTPEAMGKLMQDEGLDNVYLMAPNYQAGKDMLAGFQRYYKRKVSGQILTKLGQKDFQAELSQVRAAKPGALFIFQPGGMGIAFMKQWAASGLGKSLPLYTVFTIDEATLPAIGEAAIGTYHTSYWGPDLDNAANKDFVASFQKKYNYMPSAFAAQAYDMPFLLDSGIRAVGGDLSNKDGLIAAMEKADYDSVRGRYTYNINHIPIQNFYKREVIRGADGKPTIVIRGAVFENHKDSYYKECNMK